MEGCVLPLTLLFQTLMKNAFIKADWLEIYKDAKEAILPNAPEPRGNEITMTCFVDADHAGIL